MIITTCDGKDIDVTPWLETMCENLRQGRSPLEQTPISQNADGGYFWWDEEKNPALAKRSVSKLIRMVKSHGIR